MRIIIALFIAYSFSCISSSCLAQKDTSGSDYKFGTIVKIGLLNGEDDKVGASLGFISGLKYRKWFGGVGAGLDYYAGFKSIPIFIEVVRDINARKNAPFLNAAVGYNIPLKNKTYKPWLDYQFKGGLFYSLGGGYKFALSNALALTLSAGYSFKSQKEKDIVEYGPGPFGQPLPPRIDDYFYKFRRLYVNVGFVF
jgi:hypothetical protein